MPVPLPRGKNKPTEYVYPPGVTMPPNELAFAAHQAAVLGGPVFREDSEPGQGSAPAPVKVSSKSTKQKSRLKSRVPQAPQAPRAPQAPNKPKRKQFFTYSSPPGAPQAVDQVTTRHHIRDPQFGELEVKQIDVGARSSIPRNILANLLRVTTGDELIEFDS